MGKIVLLASYPKSGNTWIRAFLTSLWRDGTNVNINRLMVPNASSKDFIESLLFFGWHGCMWHGSMWMADGAYSMMRGEKWFNRRAQPASHLPL